MQPSETMAWSICAPLIFEAGKKRGRVKMGALISKKLKAGSSLATSRFASKKARMVPISSQ
jgi:hypothetical protein